MFGSRRIVVALAMVAVAAVATSHGPIHAQAQQAQMQPVNELPNPYQSIENYFKLPEGRTWGSTSAVEIDKDGRSIWVGERCGANSCLDADGTTIKNIPTI